jgi:hypothetical protein
MQSQICILEQEHTFQFEKEKKKSRRFKLKLTILLSKYDKNLENDSSFRRS